jgi:hypothetical protein
VGIRIFKRRSRPETQPVIDAVQAPPPLGFIERYPRLLQTSQTGLVPERLDKRFTILVENYRDLIAGRRILDLASHDGRWSLAALDVGAAHVTGIEARPHLVENARDNCQAYGFDSRRHEFVLGNVFDVLQNRTFERIDTVFCFGFFYHVARHVELIDRLRPKAVILDTGISPGSGCSMEWIREKVDEEPNAAGDRLARAGWALVGYPTRKVIELMWGHFGYKIVELEWKSQLEGVPGMDDYRFDKRASFLALPDSLTNSSVS